MEKHPLLEWMQANGKSQADLAADVGCKGSHLSLLLKGKRGVSLSLALRISRATDGVVPVDVFLREEAAQ